MWDFFRSLIQSDSLSPHGICLLWRPELVWTHAISDGVIGLAYFSIPLVLVSFVMQRRDVHFSWVVWCFAAFILACGTTHFLSIWTLWVPDYGIEAVIKAVAAVISLFTAFAHGRCCPKLSRSRPMRNSRMRTALWWREWPNVTTRWKP